MMLPCRSLLGKVSPSEKRGVPIYVTLDSATAVDARVDNAYSRILLHWERPDTYRRSVEKKLSMDLNSPVDGGARLRK